MKERLRDIDIEDRPKRSSMYLSKSQKEKRRVRGTETI